MGVKNVSLKKLLLENVDINRVTNAIQSKIRVIINYRTKGEDKSTGKRVIEPYVYGLTKSGNPVIRAYQPFGDTTTKVPSWKFFRLDRIISWEETDYNFTRPISDYKDVPKFNKDGDETMSTVYLIAKFNDKAEGGLKNQIGFISKDKIKRDKSIYDTNNNKNVGLKDVDKKELEKNANKNFIRQMSDDEFNKVTKGWKSPFNKKKVDVTPNISTSEEPYDEKMYKPQEVPNVEDLLITPTEIDDNNVSDEDTFNNHSSNFIRQMSDDEFNKVTKGWKSPFNKKKI